MPQTLYWNGSVVTMTGPEAVAEALLARDGKIEAVGSLAALEAQTEPDARRVDLRGGALLPGFIDPHSHIMQYAGALRYAPLGECRSIDALVEALRAQLAHTPKGGWVIGFGYDNNLLAEGRHPDKRDLDRVSTETPVMISHASGHMGVLNAAALRASDIGPDSPDPSGGVIGRLPGSREPSGYLEENAFIRIGSSAPRPTEAEQIESLARAQQIYASYGVTTAQEGLLKAPEFAVLDAAAKQGALHLDVVAYADIKDNARLVPDHPEYASYRNRLRIGGYKLFLDGSPQGRTAWLTEPYLPQAGQPDDYRAYPIYTDAQVKAYVEQAARDKKQLLVHCNGDAAVDQLLAAYEAPNPNRNVIIHAQLLRPDQLPRVRVLGLIPSYFVAHTYYWGDAHLKNLGRARAGRISPLGSTIRAGLPFTLHQDTPVLPPDMLDTVCCAMRRVTRNGKQLDAAESVSAYEALCGVTKYAAWQYFEEDSKGTLEPGKRADFAVLEANPLDLPAEQIRALKIRATVKDDAVVYGEL